MERSGELGTRRHGMRFDLGASIHGVDPAEPRVSKKASGRITVLLGDYGEITVWRILGAAKNAAECTFPVQLHLVWSVRLSTLSGSIQRRVRDFLNFGLGTASCERRRLFLPTAKRVSQRNTSEFLDS